MLELVGDCGGKVVKECMLSDQAKSERITVWSVGQDVMSDIG